MELKVLVLNPPFLEKFSRSSRSPAVTKISINGDNIIFESLKPFAEEFDNGREDARIMLCERGNRNY